MRMDKEKLSPFDWLNLLGLSGIAVICYCYVWGYSTFAEKHVQLPFLNFPIFVGEMLLMFCVGVYCLRWRPRTEGVRLGHLLIMSYAAFILAKAFWGYAKWGPLALRHAALLYYPVFIFFAQTFFRKEFFSKPVRYLLTMIVLGTLVTQSFSRYFVLTLFLLAVILIRSLPEKGGRLIFAGILLLGTPYHYFFETARMMILGNIVSGFYLFLVACSVLKWRWQYKTGLLVVGMVVLISLAVRIAGYDRVRSIVDFRRMHKVFQKYDQKVQARIDGFELMPRESVQFYNPNSSIKEGPIDGEGMDPLAASLNGSAAGAGQEAVTETPSPPVRESSVTDTNNAVFRLMIWRDMWQEYMREFSWFGFDFGKPLRSVSLEILKWGRGEWARDGWVSPHNSFFHIIYRTGLMGLFFIGTVMWTLAGMIRICLDRKSVTGILLCGIIINWFVASNFLVVLELPYTAIPIWSLYGLTMAYCSGLKRQSRKDIDTTEAPQLMSV